MLIEKAIFASVLDQQSHKRAALFIIK